MCSVNRLKIVQGKVQGKMVWNFFYRYNEKSRRKKIKKFFQLMDASSADLFLDAGGGRSIGYRDIWNYFKRVIILDLTKKSMETVYSEFNHIRAIDGDLCNAPLKDKSVDFIFSNAVIEHIDREKRPLFAKEVKRVARKGYFITTPNYWFPFEPHYLCPFWQYFPEWSKRLLKRYFSLGHYKKGLYVKIDLLTKKELQNLFPEANVRGIRVASLLPEILICWYREKSMNNSTGISSAVRDFYAKAQK